MTFRNPKQEKNASAIFDLLRVISSEGRLCLPSYPQGLMTFRNPKQEKNCAAILRFADGHQQRSSALPPFLSSRSDDLSEPGAGECRQVFRPAAGEDPKVFD